MFDRISSEYLQIGRNVGKENLIEIFMRAIPFHCPQFIADDVTAKFGSMMSLSVYLS